MMSSSPTMRAYRDSVVLDTPELVGRLRDMLGATLVAYVGGVKETRAVRQWAEGTRRVAADTESRLRLAFQVASLVTASNSAAVVQAWFQGLNPMLDDRSPARLLREGSVDVEGGDVLTAARAFTRVG